MTRALRSRTVVSLGAFLGVVGCVGAMAGPRRDVAERAFAQTGTEKSLAISSRAAVDIAVRTARARVAGGESDRPLDFDRASARLEREQGRWIVFIPEVQPRARPHGLTLSVDASTGECRVVIVE